MSVLFGFDWQRGLAVLLSHGDHSEVGVLGVSYGTDGLVDVNCRARDDRTNLRAPFWLSGRVITGARGGGQDED